MCKFVCPHVEFSFCSVVWCCVLIHVKSSVSCFAHMRVVQNWFVRCLCDCTNVVKKHIFRVCAEQAFNTDTRLFRYYLFHYIFRFSFLATDVRSCLVFHFPRKYNPIESREVLTIHFTPVTLKPPLVSWSPFFINHDWNGVVRSVII